MVCICTLLYIGMKKYKYFLHRFYMAGFWNLHSYFIVSVAIKSNKQVLLGGKNGN